MHAERTPPEAPPCHDCRVELDPENEDAARVYMTTRRQIITAGMEGRPIDISIPAVKIAMDLFNIQNQADCLLRVRKAWHDIKREEANAEG